MNDRQNNHTSTLTLARAIVLWLGFISACLLIPLAGGRFANGLPLNHPGDFLIAGISLMLILAGSEAVARRRVFWMLLLLVLAAAGLRLGAWHLQDRHGLYASYHYQGPDGRWRPVFSIYRPGSGHSKIDSQIAFAGIGVTARHRSLWSDFLNETGYDFLPEQRLQRPLRITWSGYITAPRACQITVRSNGQARITTPATLHAGIAAAIVIQASFNNLRAPYLRLLTSDDRQVIPGNWLTPQLPTASPLAQKLAPGLLWLSYALLACFLLLAIRVVIRQPKYFDWRFIGYGLLVLVPVVITIGIWEVRVAQDPSHTILAGNDYLLYETQARNLLRYGLRHDDHYPFHRSPAMRYYLALSHLLFGEDGYGVVLWQQVLRGLTALLTLATWRALVANAHWLWGWSIATLVLFVPKAAKFSIRYWPVTLATFLLALLVWCLTCWEKRRSGPWLLAAGLTCGLLALVRTNAIILLPALPLWLLWQKCSWRQSVLAMTAMLSILSLVPLRNRLVTGNWALTPTQGPINIIIGNNIPGNIELPKLSINPEYRRRVFYQGLARLLDFRRNPTATFDPFPGSENYHLQRPLLAVFFAYLHQRPGHFAGQLLRKTRQFFLPLRHDRFLGIITLAALLGIWWLWRRQQLAGWSTIIALVVVYALPIIIAYFESRHRLAVQPQMALLAGYACFALGNSWWRRRHAPDDLPRLPG